MRKWKSLLVLILLSRDVIIFILFNSKNQFELNSKKNSSLQPPNKKPEALYSSDDEEIDNIEKHLAGVENQPTIPQIIITNLTSFAIDAKSNAKKY